MEHMFDLALENPVASDIHADPAQHPPHGGEGAVTTAEGDAQKISGDVAVANAPAGAATSSSFSSSSSSSTLGFSMVDWFFSCIFEPAKKDGDGEIVYEDVRQIKFIGSGSHGCVFLGEYQGKTVAVKKLKELTITLKEARHLRELKHENIIGFQGVCLRPPNYCVVMEYCPRSLMEEIRERPIPPELVLDWATQIAKGMDYLHKRGFIHRDLKSPNILITHNDVLKISDFGTLREYAGHSEKLSFVGTVAWLAPEVIRNEDCSEKVDVWSYGVVLWELLTGKVPYKGVEEAAVVYGVGSNRLHLPVPVGVPDGFSLLLKQCFNFTPKHRPVFRQILLHLEILAADTAFIAQPHQTYFAAQADWGVQVARHFEELRRRKLDIPGEDALRRLDEEVREAQRARQAYEEGIERANAMMQELAMLREHMITRTGSTSSSSSKTAASRSGRVVVGGRTRHRRSGSSGSRRTSGAAGRSPGSGSGRLASRVREGLRTRNLSSMTTDTATDSMHSEEEDGEEELTADDDGAFSEGVVVSSP